MASLTPMSGTLGMTNAKHLIRRTTYNITKSQIDSFTNMTVSDAVDSLFNIQPLTIEEPLDYQTGQAYINSGITPISGNPSLRRYVKSWWLHEAYSCTSIHYKMMLFLHQYFIVNLENTPYSKGFDYLELLRFYAVGSYKELSRKMIIDNAMLKYLDGDSNTESNPNENFAREFLELFTIGKGPQIGPGNYTNYTEDDIIAASKLLTGWRDSDRPQPADNAYIDLETGLQAGYPDHNRHDDSDKTFSAAFGGVTITGAFNETDMHRELDDFVEMIFLQDATAKTICRRLYRYFVSRNISSEIESDIITPLATTLRDNNYNLEIALKQLFKSQHFYDADDSNTGDEIIGGLIKTPLDLIFPTVSYFQIPIPDATTQTKDHYQEWYRESVDETICTLSSFQLFAPEAVAGYQPFYQAPSYDRNWINANTIVARYKIPEMLISGNRILKGGDLGAGIQIDLVDFLENSGIISNVLSAETIVTELIDYLFCHPASEGRYHYFLNDIFLEGAPSFDWTIDWIDYQNTGDDSAVRIPLESLFKALLYSQEYQLM